MQQFQNGAEERNRTEEEWNTVDTMSVLITLYSVLSRL